VARWPTVTSPTRTAVGGEQNYSFDEMKAAEWHISLSLG
jgi:hypothetical protein